MPAMLLCARRGGLGDQEWYAVHTAALPPQLLQSRRIPCKVQLGVDDAQAAFIEALRSMDSSLQAVSIAMDARLTDREEWN